MSVSGRNWGRFPNTLSNRFTAADKCAGDRWEYRFVILRSRVLTTHYLIVDFVDALADHVLDRYQHAIRYFGLSAPGAKRTSSAVLFALLGQIRRPRQQRLGWANSLLKYFRVDPLVDSHGQSIHWVRRMKPTAK